MRINKTLVAISIAYAVAWAIALANTQLIVVAALAFVQNLAFTFVSRGRNSGSLIYHMVASIFSNGIFIVMFAWNVDIVASAAGFPLAFAACYTLSTLSGSVFAHWAAHKLEARSKSGKTQQGQQSKVEALEGRYKALLAEVEVLRSDLVECTAEIALLMYTRNKLLDVLAAETNLQGGFNQLTRFNVEDKPHTLLP